MEKIEVFLMLIGSFILIIELIIIWKYLKYKKIWKKIVYSNAENLTIKSWWKAREKEYNNLIVKNKIQIYKKIMIILAITIMLIAIIGGAIGG